MSKVLSGCRRGVVLESDAKEDLHEAEEGAQVHWPIHLIATIQTKEVKIQGTVIVPMMPKLCNMEIIMPRAQVVEKRVEAFVVTGEFRK